MLHYLIPFAVMLGQVFFKSVQQLNVVYGNYKLIYPVSLGMCAMDALIVYFLYNAIQAQDLLTILFVGLGGGTGAIIGMKVHKHIRRNDDPL